MEGMSYQTMKEIQVNNNGVPPKHVTPDVNMEEGRPTRKHSASNIDNLMTGLVGPEGDQGNNQRQYNAQRQNNAMPGVNRNVMPQQLGNFDAEFGVANWPDCHALKKTPQGALLRNMEYAKQTRNELCNVVTLWSGKQCEVETSIKHLVQCQENELVNEPKETIEKKEAKSSNASHQTNANETDECQVEDKLKSILRMEVAQLCQEVDDDDDSDGMIENTKEEALEEVSYFHQPEPLGHTLTGTKPRVPIPLDL
ncbi:hypothetical protein V6N13_096784 [Hibiscus sabdariffa]